MMESLAAIVAAETPETFDAYLASLHPSEKFDINNSCGCFLHHKWESDLGYGGLSIGITDVAWWDSSDQLSEIVALPDWLRNWQERLLDQQPEDDPAVEVVVTVAEARAALADLTLVLV